MMQLPNFDELMRLAYEEPAQLEAIRNSAVESLISNAPEHLQQRLRGLQFRIDASRRGSSNPMAACLKISQMMHDQLQQLSDSLNHPAPAATSHSSKIIPFPLQANS